ncbi:hypothetical protein BD413DRAFT_677405 [Trametes elegans]|nr:hypothetical protein BD413DRAFT_677405 [Trametes elegans]
MTVLGPQRLVRGPPGTLDFAGTLPPLEHGADSEQQDRFGRVPLMRALQNDRVAVVGVLLDFGADLAVTDPDGTPEEFSGRAGAALAALVQRWKRRRAVLLEMRNGVVLVEGVPTWQSHKLSCVGFTAENTVTVTTSHEDIYRAVPTSDLVHVNLGFVVKTQRNVRGTHTSHTDRRDEEDGHQGPGAADISTGLAHVAEIGVT